MRIDLSYVELHSSLFFNETNFGTKLYGIGAKDASGRPLFNKNKAPLELWYETELEHTFIVWGQHVALVETTASKTIKDIEQLKKYITLKNPTTGILNKQSDATASIASLPQVKAQASGPGQDIMRSAQVETPHSKVQDTTKRKPKYQGEVVE